MDKFIVWRWRKRLRLEGLRLFREKGNYFGLCVGAGWSLIAGVEVNDCQSEQLRKALTIHPRLQVAWGGSQWDNQIDRKRTAMKTFETSATVEDQGRVLLAGLPFAPGTMVEVTVSEKAIANPTAEPAKLAEPLASVRHLFAQVRAKNTESIGPLRREDLYDRKVLR